MSAPTLVRAVVAGTHRLQVVNAATGDRVGTVNVRPRDTALFTAADMNASVAMFCELFNAMHPGTAYQLAADPHTTPLLIEARL